MVFASFAGAKDKAAAKGPHGKVSKVEKDSADTKLTDITLTSGHGDKAKETVIKVAADVKVTKDGADATLADVTVGVLVNVTEEGDKVTLIAIHAPKPKTPK